MFMSSFLCLCAATLTVPMCQLIRSQSHSCWCLLISSSVLILRICRLLQYEITKNGQVNGTYSVNTEKTNINVLCFNLAYFFSIQTRCSSHGTTLVPDRHCAGHSSGPPSCNPGHPAVSLLSSTVQRQNLYQPDHPVSAGPSLLQLQRLLRLRPHRLIPGLFEPHALWFLPDPLPQRDRVQRQSHLLLWT